MNKVSNYNKETMMEIISQNLPLHVAFILDGNRRWARKWNLPVYMGHKQGAENVKNLLEWCIKCKIKYLTIYCLSKDNLKRSEEELVEIFKMLKQYLLLENIKKLNAKGINVEIIGDFNSLPSDVTKAIQHICKIDDKDTKLHLQICIGYSGRNEIVSAVQAIARDINTGVIGADDINNKLFEKYLATKDIPDVDLMIRSGGEKRLSDFLLWKLAYSELYFCDKLFPDFTEQDFLLALYFFATRERRYGK